MAILQLSKAIEFLQSPPSEQLSAAYQHYLTDTVAFNDIHNFISSIATSGPSPATLAVFAWLVIHCCVRNTREAYRLQIEADAEAEPTGIEQEDRVLKSLTDRLDSIGLTDEEMEVLANCAVGTGRAHDVVVDLTTKLVAVFSSPVDRIFQQNSRLTLLDLIRFSLGITRYDLPVINATLAILEGERDFWSFVEQPSGFVDSVCSTFLEDEEYLRPCLLDVAQLRFPYEISPFLRLTRALATDVARSPDQHELLHQLSALPYFVQRLPSSFGAHQLSREETEHNYIRLTANLPIFQGARSGGRAIAGKGSQLALSLAKDFDVTSIPVGTEGLNNGEMLVTWDFKFSAFAYLTTLLSTAIRNSNVFDFATQASVPLDIAAEILRLFNTILAAGLKASATDISEVNAIKLVLGTVDDDSEAPLIRVIFELFEQELQSQREQPGGEGFELLVACTQSLYLITKISPDKIWPFLSRSRFFENDGLAAVIAGTEMVSGRYQLLKASIRLYDALIDDTIANAVKRKMVGTNAGVSKAVARFGEPIPGRGSPDKNMGRTLLAFTRTFTNAFESMGGWRFVDLEEKLTLNAEILSTFKKILIYSYGYSDTQTLDKKLTAALADSAEYLYEVFGSANANELSILPILANFVTGANRPYTSTLFVNHESLWVRQTVAAITFADSVLRVKHLLNHGSSQFETRLFKIIPVLTRLYAANDAYKTPVCSLLANLIKGAARGDSEPPSLLGHMGEDRAKAFLSLLTQLGKPLNRPDVEIAIWKLVSAVVSGRQQWFATFLLTGRTPREETKAWGNTNPASTDTHGGRSLLAFALDELCKISELSPQRSIAMLEFLMLSQNNWPWAMAPLRSHPRFLAEIQIFVGQLRPEDVQGNSEKTILTAERYRMASSIAEILAMYLHQAKRSGNAEALVKEMIPRLGFYKNFAIAAPEDTGGGRTFTIPTYNTSLHGNLERNFSKKYPGVKLGDFKRILKTESAPARDYYYDTNFAKWLLDFSPSWAGRKNDGYAADFVRANINLYLVQTQVDVLKGWQMLASELSYFLKSDAQVPELLAKVVRDCLEANINNSLPSTPLFEKLNQVRVDFAFVLSQKLVQAKIENDGVKALLGKVWDAIRGSGHDFETAFSGDGTEYYRSLLKLLYLVLQFHLNPQSRKSPNTAVLQTESTLLEILSKVIATGFRSLANNLHDNPSTPTVPSDLVLLTALLQCILRVPAMKLVHSQIGLQFASNTTVRFATSLFTWSDQLAGSTNRDPIYAELSLLFLLELSSVPEIAESMAVEGVLAAISTANVTSYFRREAGVGPFDTPSRLHTVWSKGILPLCLNLLRAVGAPVAPEVSAFLNQFPGQLSRSPATFGKANVSPNELPRYQVTLTMAGELHSLALISTIIETMRNESPNGAEIESLLLDRIVLKEDLEGWVRGRRSLMDRVVATNEREVRLANTKAAAISPVDNVLEERVLAECKAAVECLNVETK